MKKSVVFSGILVCLVSGSALFVIATRPAEPKAQAALESPRHIIQNPVMDPGESRLILDEIVIKGDVKPVMKAAPKAGKPADVDCYLYWTSACN